MSHNIRALGEKVEALRAEIVELDAVEAPTEEQAARFDAAITEFDAAKADLDKAVERAAKVEAVRAAAEVPANVEPVVRRAPSVNVRKDPFADVANIRFESRTSEDVAERAITAISDTKYGAYSGVTDAAREATVRTIETVPGAAHLVLANGSPAYRSAFIRWARAGGINPRYTDEEIAALEQSDLIRAALNITTGSTGQFSLPTLFDPTLIHTGSAAVNPIRAIARVERGTQNVWNGVSVGNVTTYWHAEAAAHTEGSPTLAHPVVTAGDLSAWVVQSHEFFDDSPMVSQLPGLIGEAFDYAESTAFVTGSGTNRPLGVVTAISATGASTVTATTRGMFTSASSADVYRVVNALEPRYENTSSWIANKATFNTIRQMSPNGAGSLFWGDLSQRVTPNPTTPLLGSPTYNSSDVLSTTTTGTVLAVLGDFSQYLVYDRLGTTVEFIQNVVDTSGIPTGQRGLLARKRVGANTTDINAFRFLLA